MNRLLMIALLAAYIANSISKHCSLNYKGSFFNYNTFHHDGSHAAKNVVIKSFFQIEDDAYNYQTHPAYTIIRKSLMKIEDKETLLPLLKFCEILVLSDDLYKNKKEHSSNIFINADILNDSHKISESLHASLTRIYHELGVSCNTLNLRSE